MSRAGLVYYASGRIEVIHDSQLAAVCCHYVRAYDEAGVFVQGAVRAGLGYAEKHNLANWIVDVSAQVDGMSEVDQVWESLDGFFQLFRNSTIRKILLVIPTRGAGETVEGELAWAQEFAGQLGDDFSVGVASSVTEIRDLFQGSPK